MSHSVGCPCPRLGLDGHVCVGEIDRDRCCPPKICEIDLCDLRCNLVDLLPSGPMWDRAKAQAFIGPQSDCDDCHDPQCATCHNQRCPDCGPCVSVVGHALYTADTLFDRIHGALYPALREQSPYTAYYTLDEWLDRLGWQDCYRCGCRDCDDESGLGPLEVLRTINGRQRVVCCAPEFSEDLQRAVKRGIAIALWRINKGIIRNVDAINFVIRELGARLTFQCFRDVPLDPRRCWIDDGWTAVDCFEEPEPGACEPPDEAYRCPAQACDSLTLGGTCGPLIRQFCYRVSPDTDTILAPLANCPDACQRHDPIPADRVTACAIHPGNPVQAYFETRNATETCDVGRIYPGVLAAECIVKSLAPPGIRVKIEP